MAEEENTNRFENFGELAMNMNEQDKFEFERMLDKLPQDELNEIIQKLEPTDIPESIQALIEDAETLEKNEKTELIKMINDIFSLDTDQSIKMSKRVPRKNNLYLEEKEAAPTKTSADSPPTEIYTAENPMHAPVKDTEDTTLRKNKKFSVVTFQPSATIGMKIKNDKLGNIVVSNVTPGGMAEKKDVVQGARVVMIGDETPSTLADAKEKIIEYRSKGKPYTISFQPQPPSDFVEARIRDLSTDKEHILRAPRRASKKDHIIMYSEARGVDPNNINIKSFKHTDRVGGGYKKRRKSSKRKSSKRKSSKRKSSKRKSSKRKPTKKRRRKTRRHRRR